MSITDPATQKALKQLWSQGLGTARALAGGGNLGPTNPFSQDMHRQFISLQAGKVHFFAGFITILTKCKSTIYCTNTILPHVLMLTHC